MQLKTNIIYDDQVNNDLTVNRHDVAFRFAIGPWNEEIKTPHSVLPMKLSVGLIGLGADWESRYRPALRALSDRFEVKVVCAAVQQRAERAARDFGALAVDGFRAITERDYVEALLILSTDWIGPLPIFAACDFGKAVYSSAALDIEPTQVHELKKRVDESGIAFMAELPRRYAPATLRLKELIATRLGAPKLLFCHERLTVEDSTNAYDRSQFQTAALRHLTELADWCRYVVGTEPTSILSARNQPEVGGGASFYQSASLNFSESSDHGGEGPLAQLSIGQYLPEKWRDALPFRRPASLQICCENGVAFIDLPSTLIWFDDAGQHSESLDSERPVGEQMLTHFHRAVTSLIRKTSDLDDAYKALTMVTAANESVRDHKRVLLNFE